MFTRHKILILFLLFSPGLYAQEGYTIYGTVKDISGAAVPAAFIILEKKSDSSIVKTQLADSAGKYSIQAMQVAGLSVRVEAPGFISGEYELPDSAGGTVLADFVLLPRNNELERVTVTASKPLYERKADRIIFNLQNSIATIGGNALEALKKAPAVTVREQDQTISLAGKSSVLILVNNRLLQLSGEDLLTYLQSIPAENIDRIEIITTPPAQYEAAGNSGLINIILKKNNRNGINGDLRSAYEQATHGTASGGAGVNFRKDRLNLYGSANYSEGAKAVAERLNTEYPGQQFRLSDHYRKTVINTQYTFGADYAVRKNGLLGLQLTGSRFKREDNSDGRIIVVRTGTDIIDSVVRTPATSQSVRDNNSANLNYVWDIDTAGRKLILNANMLWLESDRQRDFESVNCDGLSGLPTGVQSRSRNKGAMGITITAVQADATLPGKYVNLSIGGEFSSSVNNSINSFQNYQNGIYVADPNISNEFSYEEQLQALYISAEKVVGKWQFQAGVRGEATQTRGYSSTLNQTTTRSYFNIFPTAYVLWQPDEIQSINLNYSKRINRPGYADLDPFRSYSSPYSYIEGNPFLQPSYNHNLELNYTFRSRYNFTAFYQFEQDHFGQLFFVDSMNNGTYVKRANFGDNTNYGLSITAAFNPASWWELNLELSGFVQKTSSSYYQDAIRQYQSPSLYGRVVNSVSMNSAKTLLAEVSFFYFSRYQAELFFWGPQSSLDAGIKAMLAGKKLVLGISATDILASQRPRGTNQVTGQTINSYFDVRNVRLTASYKFGRSTIKSKRERSTGIEEEKSRL